VEDRLESLEGQTNHITEPETIIPGFRNPDTCVFCTNEDYDSIFNLVVRVAYQHKIGKELDKQEKQTCIHHTDNWLKYSLYTAGFISTSFMDGKESIAYGEIDDLLKNKKAREKLLTKEYDADKNYTCAIDLYLPKSSNTNTKGRYNNAFTIEDDIPIQNKIIHDKVKTYYTNAIEVLNAFDE